MTCMARHGVKAWQGSFKTLRCHASNNTENQSGVRDRSSLLFLLQGFYASPLDRSNTQTLPPPPSSLHQLSHPEPYADTLGVFLGLAFALFSTSRKGWHSLWMAYEWLGYYDMKKHGDKHLRIRNALHLPPVEGGVYSLDGMREVLWHGKAWCLQAPPGQYSGSVTFWYGSGSGSVDSYPDYGPASAFWFRILIRETTI